MNCAKKHCNGSVVISDLLCIHTFGRGEGGDYVNTPYRVSGCLDLERVSGMVFAFAGNHEPVMSIGCTLSLTENGILCGKSKLSEKKMKEGTMNKRKLNVHWMTLSLLIALSAIIANLSVWQLGFVAVILIISLLRMNHRGGRNRFRNRRSTRK